MDDDKWSNLAIVFLGIAFLSGCSTMRINASVNPSPEEALKTYKVEEYSLTEITRYKAEPLGKVTSSYCRRRTHQPEPSESMLMGNLKYKAQRLGANGIVMMECVDHQLNDSCEAFLRCDALAYKVDFDRL
ncbi:hypothetical protein [Shewanella sp. Isolate11]|uniref:hypothetical protein n=1 Tax=Shewanella sp. Isolate11 TaxID=2908530 RepID=UPI001EFD7479|nr:hypothetical protein [Shewanella sp. Isolate11]MCG9695586.1 hypothetical protein [Shewanella sp. Isolate11]